MLPWATLGHAHILHPVQQARFKEMTIKPGAHSEEKNQHGKGAWATFQEEGLQVLAIVPWRRCFFIFFKYQKGLLVERNQTYFWWLSWLDLTPEDDSHTETAFSPAVHQSWWEKEGQDLHFTGGALTGLTATWQGVATGTLSHRSTARQGTVVCPVCRDSPGFETTCPHLSTLRDDLSTTTLFSEPSLCPHPSSNHRQQGQGQMPDLNKAIRCPILKWTVIENVLVAYPVSYEIVSFRAAMFRPAARGAKKPVCRNKQGSTTRRIFAIRVPGAVWGRLLPCPHILLQNIPLAATTLVTERILITIAASPSGPSTGSATGAPVPTQPFEVGSWTIVCLFR